MKFTKEHIEKLLKDGKIRGYKVTGTVQADEKVGKYGNKKVVVDGITFDSKREGTRYFQLKMLGLAGEISDLKLQVPYELNEGGTHSLKYIADFVYKVKGVTVVEDCKGYRTREYKKKRRLMKKIYGIEIKET